MNSGAFDPLGEAVDLVHRHGGWVHIDGATLSVPYDSGLAVVASASSLYEAMGVHAAYLIQDERPDPMATVPEFSNRARGFASGRPSAPSALADCESVPVPSTGG